MIDFNKLKEEAAKEPVSATDIYGSQFIDECINESLIDRHAEYKGDKFVLTFDEANNQYAPVMSLSNISATIGPAKSKKTFFSTMVASAFVDGHKYGMKGDLDNRKLVLFDTEQGKGHVQKVLKRIWNITGRDDVIDVFAFRKFYDQKLRLSLIEKVLNSGNYSVAIIDGAVDLMKNYNDLEESQSLVGKLMSWTETLNMHINSIVHMAKSSIDARGHLGTELMNKSETVFKLIPDEGNVSKVHCHRARNRPFTEFDFMINDEALPCRLDYPDGGLPQENIQTNNYYEKETNYQEQEELFNGQTNDVPF